eukprot:1156156-Pelagomonas_calceolata.AAC.6
MEIWCSKISHGGKSGMCASLLVDQGLDMQKARETARGDLSWTGQGWGAPMLGASENHAHFGERQVAGRVSPGYKSQCIFLLDVHLGRHP